MDKLKPLLLSLIAFSLVLISYWLQIKPNRDKYNTLVKEETGLRLEFETKQRVANVEAYKKQEIDLTKRYQEKLKLLVSIQEINSLLDKLAQTAVTSGLSFVFFAQKSIIKHDFYSEKPIDIVVIGEYWQLVFFLSQIAEWDRLISFNNFVLTKLILNKHRAVVDSEVDKLLRMEIFIKIYLK